ncbi:cold-shock protein [Paenibacillus sp. SEL3]|jgi:hypothetical protein|uniref:Cold-shock protein n=2 Tax=Paenibacillus TaxID=44249 RepID=A0A8I1IV15_PAEPO|nr:MULTISPECIES: cold-shock protein [Paenibacillus]MCF2716391.1 cold-shock protein [Paenibacillus sp. UKAQ_18]AJW69357.1 hypothetical protein PPE_06510 [Paenibacillus polymyxa E681]KAF6575779.1 cold-shock protein [Paenibacillus sp. EKM206P]KAF6579244.1 cold-shock protein [Paenibacillus sp. EKM212P]KAF6589412.1 cold-shock protein [Paenibacillus sp. EKM205P]
MYRRQAPEIIPEENTAIWSCTNEGCNGWMRTDFTFLNEPACPFCQASMGQEMRMLPILNRAGNSFVAQRS